MTARPTRRQFLQVAGVGTAGAMVLARPAWADSHLSLEVQDAYVAAQRERWMEMGARPGLDGKMWVSVVARYLTDPERIARMLPPPLEPASSPEVLMDWFVAVPPVEAERRTVMHPGFTYGEADVFVACSFEGKDRMLEVELDLHQDWGRSSGRDNIALQKKDGRVTLDFAGDRARATLTRQGRVLAGIETVLTDRVAHPRVWLREIGWGWLHYVYRLHADWRTGLIEDEFVELWTRGAAKGGLPTEIPDAERLPRAGDPSQTTLYCEPWPSNPYCEFPVREWIGVSGYVLGGYPTHVRGLVVRGEERQTVQLPSARLARVPAADFEPWALSMKAYDRPISRGKTWVPSGWPEQTTALKVAPEEIERYRARKALEVELTELVDIQYEIDPAVQRAALPPALEPGDPPLSRILALDVGVSDLSTRPFTELWLMVGCEIDTGPAWYALAHIVGWDGDVCYGRETFGYPSKLGEPEITTDAIQIDVRGRRLYRDFFRGVVPLSLDPPQPRADRFEVVGIHVHPWQRSPRADLVSQPWTVEMEAARCADPAWVTLLFPEEPGPGKIGLTDPWFELKPTRVVSAKAGRAAMRRFPCRTVGDLPDFIHWWIERLDGGSRDEGKGTFLNPRASEFWQERFGPDGTETLIDKMY
jgi:acetoacetate decarboxylase